MNGFQMKAESLRRQGQNKQADLYDFLGGCSQDDINALFDSSAFNEISMGYVRLAVRQLTDEGRIEEEQARAVRNRVSLLFDEKQAREVFES